MWLARRVSDYRLAGREDGSLLRIWVPGCATGEEAYSLVIVLLEILRRLVTSDGAVRQ